MRRIVAVLGAVALAAAVSFPASAGRSPALSTWLNVTRSAVEQQGHIDNPTTCLWDTDDYQEHHALGAWPAGYSATFTLCVIGDWVAHAWVVGASDPRLTVSLVTESGPDGVTCAVGPDYDHDYPLPPVGAGVGLRESITFTVSNDSGQRVGSRGKPVTVVAAGYPSYFLLNDRVFMDAELRDVCPDFWSMPLVGEYPGPWWRQ